MVFGMKFFKRKSEKESESFKTENNKPFNERVNPDLFKEKTVEQEEVQSGNPFGLDPEEVAMNKEVDAKEKAFQLEGKNAGIK